MQEEIREAKVLDRRVREKKKEMKGENVMYEKERDRKHGTEKEKKEVFINQATYLWGSRGRHSPSPRPYAAPWWGGKVHGRGLALV